MGIEIGFFVGALILLVALVWGTAAYRRRDKANIPVTNEATRELYADTDSYGSKEDRLRAKTRS